MQDIARVAGVQVPQGALRNEPASANNVITGRPRIPSTQGSLQRARQMAAKSAEQLLTAGGATGASSVKGQSVITGASVSLSCLSAQELSLNHPHTSQSTEKQI